MVDLQSQYEQIREEINLVINEVVESGHFVLGPNVIAFESEIAAYLGVEHAVGVASGTDALVIALRAAGIQPGDEVILPAFTFFATMGAVLMVGAEPVLVDIDPSSYLIDTTQLDGVLTRKTKAIIPVHLFGQPANMDNILAFADEHNLIIIEDNAQGIGAEYKGSKTGSIGHVGCLSFFPSKNLGAYGDGGMLVTNDEEIAQIARKLRTHGWSNKYQPEMLGYNSRLDEIQAAVLRVKLKYLDGWNDQRRKIAQQYSSFLSGLDIGVPLELTNRSHIYHLYVIRLQRRDLVMQALREAGIASGIYYPLPLHLTQPYDSVGRSGKVGQFPVSEAASNELLALPIYPGMTPAQVKEVCNQVQKILAKLT